MHRHVEREKKRGSGRKAPQRAGCHTEGGRWLRPEPNSCKKAREYIVLYEEDGRGRRGGLDSSRHQTAAASGSEKKRWRISKPLALRYVRTPRREQTVKSLRRSSRVDTNTFPPAELEAAVPLRLPLAVTTHAPLFRIKDKWAPSQGANKHLWLSELYLFPFIFFVAERALDTQICVFHRRLLIRQTEVRSRSSHLNQHRRKLMRQPSLSSALLSFFSLFFFSNVAKWRD